MRPDAEVVAEAPNGRVGKSRIEEHGLAEDPDGDIMSVEFFVNGVSIFIDVDGSDGWHTNWLVPSMGTYVFTARITDEEDAIVTSDPVTVRVVIPGRR